MLWSGYPKEAATWEAVEDITDSAVRYSFNVCLCLLKKGVISYVTPKLLCSGLLTLSLEMCFGKLGPPTVFAVCKNGEGRPGTVYVDAVIIYFWWTVGRLVTAICIIVMS